MSTSQNQSTPYVVHTPATALELDAAPTAPKTRSDAVRLSDGPPSMYGLPSGHPEGASAFTVYNDQGVFPRASPFPPNTAFQTYSPSPFPVASQSHETTAYAAGNAATPGGPWTLVAGKAPSRSRLTSLAALGPQAPSNVEPSALPVDKGKARGPPGAPSPPRQTRPPPPNVDGTNMPVNWREMPQDFYHLGTGARNDGDLFDDQTATATTTRIHPRPSSADDGRRTDLGHRDVKRVCRHPPTQDDSFVPMSKDLERMNAHVADTDMWSTPQGGRIVRVSTPAACTQR